MQVFGVREQPLPGFSDRRLHWVKSQAVAGQHRIFQQLVQLVVQRLVAVSHAVVQRALGPQPAQCHAVERQRAGLVDAQHSGCAQQFDCRDAAREHLLTRQPPRPQPQEQRQHHRQLLREDGHRQRQAGQQTTQAVAHQPPPSQRQHAGQRQADDGDPLDDAPRLLLDRCALNRDAGQGLADAAQRAACTGGQHQAATAAAHDQGARVQHVNVRPCWREPCAAALGHRHRLTGQHRLIGRQVGGLDQLQVGRHPVALGQQHEVAQHQFATGDAPRLPTAQHQRTRAGEFAQGLQRALAAPLLHKADRHHDEHKAQQHQRFLRVAQYQVEQAAGHQQQKHRFGHHLDQQVPEAARTGDRQLIRALARQA